MDHCENCRTPLPDPLDGVPVWHAEPAADDTPPDARICDACYLALFLAVPDPSEQRPAN